MFKNHNGEKHQDTSLGSILVGAAAAGIIGAAAALLLAPKSGEKLRKDIRGAYRDLTENLHDFTHDFVEKGEASFNDYADNFKNKTSDFIHKTNLHVDQTVLTAIIAGGILGAASTLLFSRSLKSMGSFSNNYHSKNGSKHADWVTMAHELLKSIHHQINHHKENSHHHGNNQPNIDNLVSWATFGFNLWQDIKKGRESVKNR